MRSSMSAVVLGLFVVVAPSARARATPPAEGAASSRGDEACVSSGYDPITMQVPAGACPQVVQRGGSYDPVTMQVIPAERGAAQNDSKLQASRPDTVPARQALDDLARRSWAEG